MIKYQELPTLAIIWALLTRRLSAQNVIIHGTAGTHHIGDIHGNGPGRFQEGSVGSDRKISGFSGIALSGSLYASWAKAETHRVYVVAPKGIHSKIKTEVDAEGVLHLNTTGSYYSNETIEIVVTGPELDYAMVSGSGTLSVVGATGDLIDIHVEGSGDLRISGEVERLNAKVNGDGSLLAANLKAESVRIHVSGSGDATVTARNKIQAVVSGSGDLEVYGQPLIRELAKRGSGDIEVK